MDSFLSRYRNLTVLLVVIIAQLVLLGYQVRTSQDVRLIRVWSVSAVTPLAQLMEAMRSHTFGVFGNYFVLLGVREQNEQLKDEVGRLKMQNHFLRTQLSDADRARALTAFQAETPSRTLAARVIANGTGANSATVFIDRGSREGIESGMAVVTPDGIVGKVVGAYPTSSLVLLVTDPTFAAGVISQKNHVSGTLKGQGHGTCMVDYIQNEQKVDVGEWFYTSGFDRVFPRGFPVGQVTVARSGRGGKEVYLSLSGLQGVPEEVLVVLEGVHQKIPENPPAAPGVHLMAPPEIEQAAGAADQPRALTTAADQLEQTYRKIGAVENHQYGVSPSIPNFNARPPGSPAVTPAPKPPAAEGSTAVAASGAGASGVGTGSAAARPATPGAPAAGTPPKPAGLGTVGGGTNPGAKNAKPGLEAGRPAATPGLQSGVGTAPAGSAKPKSASAGAAKPAAPPRKLTAPLLVTDPTDADPAAPDVFNTLEKPKSDKPAPTKPGAPPEPKPQ